MQKPDPDVRAAREGHLLMPESSPGLPGQGAPDTWYLRCLASCRFLWKTQDGAWPVWVHALLLVLAVALVYSNTLHGPWQYDDQSDILENQSIRHLWPLRDVFFLQGRGFATRPVGNLSFAINYATGGLKPYHYHITNLLIHACASLAFLGVLRRTLALTAMDRSFREQGSSLALVMASLWALHPLLTESVAYITQRYESLAALFMFLALYALLRHAESGGGVRWVALGSLSTALALGSKEVAVSLPVLLVLFDRLFLAPSFREAWRKRRFFYLGLGVAWIAFVYIQLHPVKRGFAGFGLTIPWWKYALNQPSVILHYLRLVIWPHPLNFDYFWPVAKHWGELVPGLLIVGALLGLTCWALARRKALAFLGVSFFCILAPTSSVMPILDLAVEHRMYLPSALVIVALVVSICYGLNRLHLLEKLASSSGKMILLILISIIISTLGALTYLRNEDYQDTMDLWRDAVAKAPNNPRAHHNYAFYLAKAGYTDMALGEYEAALKQAPGMPTFQSNYGILLGRLGRYPESLEHLRLAVQMEPENHSHYVNLGGILLAKGSLDSSLICYQEAIKINPGAAISYSGLASVLLLQNKPASAMDNIKQAIARDPDNPEFPFKLGVIALMLEDAPAARKAFQAAVLLDENPAKRLADIGAALHDYALDEEAVSSLRRALQLRPGDVLSQMRLAWILATSRDAAQRNGAEALRISEQLLSTQKVRTPELLDLRAVSLAELGRYPEASAVLSEALSKSKDRKEPWLAPLEFRLALFVQGRPYRDAPKRLVSLSPTEQQEPPSKSR